MKQLSIEVEDTLFSEANEIVEELGLNLPTAIRMFLKSIVKEQSIAFILTNQHANSNPQQEIRFAQPRFAGQVRNIAQNNNTVDNHISNMTKSMAIRLFRNEGFKIGSNVTFASKNRGAYNYWANPEFGMLDNEWWLILNDWLTGKIYLFNIPANSIHPDELTPRTDKEYLIDLQIMYGDSTFTDNRSEYSFAQYLVGELSY